MRCPLCGNSEKADYRKDYGDRCYCGDCLKWFSIESNEPEDRSQEANNPLNKFIKMTYSYLKKCIFCGKETAINVCHDWVDDACPECVESIKNDRLRQN